MTKNKMQMHRDWRQAAHQLGQETRLSSVLPKAVLAEGAAPLLGLAPVVW